MKVIIFKKLLRKSENLISNLLIQHSFQAIKNITVLPRIIDNIL